MFKHYIQTILKNFIDSSKKQISVGDMNGASLDLYLISTDVVNILTQDEDVAEDDTNNLNRN